MIIREALGRLSQYSHLYIGTPTPWYSHLQTGTPWYSHLHIGIPLLLPAHWETITPTCTLGPHYSHLHTGIPSYSHLHTGAPWYSHLHTGTPLLLPVHWDPITPTCTLGPHYSYLPAHWDPITPTCTLGPHYSHQHTGITPTCTLGPHRAAGQLTGCAVWCSQDFGYFGPLLSSGTSPKFNWSEILVPGLRMCHPLVEINGLSYPNMCMDFGLGIFFVASWIYVTSAQMA